MRPAGVVAIVEIVGLRTGGAVRVDEHGESRGGPRRGGQEKAGKFHGRSGCVRSENA